MTTPWALVALSGPEANRRWDCSAASIDIGRATANTIQLRDEAVSKQHARIEWRDDGPTIVDLGSRNGTFVDGLPATEAVALTHGALITLGNCILRVELDAVEPCAFGVSVAETVVHAPEPRGPSEDVLARFDRWAGRMFPGPLGPHSPASHGELLATLLDAVDAIHVAIVRWTRDRNSIETVAARSVDTARSDPNIVSRTIVQRVTRDAQPLICLDGLDTASISDAGATDGAARRRHILCMPLHEAPAPQMFVLHLVRDASQRPFDGLDLRMAATFFKQAGAAGAGETGATPTAKAAAAGEPPLIYRSRAMDTLLSIVRRAAASNATILLQGESGTGKEVLARLIHRQSRRADGPLIRVNCASIQESLAESELFGHERGAFTGAVRRHRGRFEQASGGTLLLDEIAELSPGSQARLLRVIEDGVIERVGGEEPVPINVRLVAATHQDLRQAVSKGKFRADLLHRIAVLPIHIPPLRERREDIIALAEHFVAELSQQHLRGAATLLPEAIEELEAFDWPGNVRQLRNVVEHALVQHGGPEIDREAVGLALAYHEGGEPAEASAGMRLEDARAAFERQHIRRVLDECGWNRSEAARRLGLARQNLVQKMKKLGVAPPGAS